LQLVRLKSRLLLLLLQKCLMAQRQQRLLRQQPHLLPLLLVSKAAGRSHCLEAQLLLERV
jgi:hypothetical protein